MGGKMKYSPTAREQELYDVHGVVVLEGFIPDATCEEWDRKLKTATPSKFASEQGVTSGGFFEPGKNLYNYLDTYAIMEACPEIVDFYASNISWLRNLTDAQVVRSNYFKSAITAVQFEAPGSTQSWHRESNPVTVVAYLTNNPKQGAIEVVENEGGEASLLYPKRGRVVVMNGRYVRHRVHAMETGERRVSVVCNYYLRGDHGRPVDADEHIYGEND